MGLRKSFPKERNYEFWNIMMCSLIQSDRTQADKDRNLFGTLAFRMISKAAETIPTDQVRLEDLKMHSLLPIHRCGSPLLTIFRLLS